jgi:SAM-dependent methyltransferase
MAKDRTHARRLAQESLQKGDALGWFEKVYAQAGGKEKNVPWADMIVNPRLASWLAHKKLSGAGRRALVVGCGLGDDAEELARLGFAVVAFDISATAAAWCRRRFPHSTVEYCVADVLVSPREWVAAFEFVLEVNTLQVLSPDLRQRAIVQMAHCVAPGGTLLVIARGRDPSDDPGAMPWPLTKEEFAAFQNLGLAEIRFEDFLDDEMPPVRRFRVEYRRCVESDGGR